MKLSTVEAFKKMNTSSEDYIHLEGETLKKYQDILLTITMDIVSVCEENGIVYQLSGGSALGAIRHHGFIPWDDDMDINILGSQFDEFIQLFSEKFVGKYWIHTEHTQEYGMVIGRIRLKDSISRAREDIQNNECGIYVDLFRMENVFDNKIVRVLHGTLCMGMGLALSCRNFYKNRHLMMKIANENPNVKAIFRIKIMIGFVLSFMSVDRMAILTQKCYSLCKNSNSKNLSIPSGRKHFFGEMYTRDGMQNTVLVDFEGKKFAVASDYDTYLKKLYGNYMKIPSEEEREKHILLELKFPGGTGTKDNIL